MTDFRNLKRYRLHLRPFVRVLLAREDDLSDGYGYYLGCHTDDDDWKLATMREIAEQLYEAAQEVQRMEGPE